MMHRLTILFLIYLLFTCAENNHKSNQINGSIIQLTYWCASNPREISLAKELVKEWNLSHQDIQVILQPIPASQSSEED